MHVSVAGFQKVLQYADMFKEGMLCTVYLSFFTVLLGFLLALVLTGMRMSDIRPFRALGQGRPPPGRRLSAGPE